MNDKHIIIILLAIIIILAAAVGVALLKPTIAKQPVEIRITSNNSQYEDDATLSIILCDLNRTPITGQVVNVTVTGDNGKIVVDDVVKTDGKGKARLNLDLKKGEYNVNVTYDGNGNYTGNGTSQKLTIEEYVVVQTQEENYDLGAFYSYQDGRTIYTGEVQNGPDGGTWKHLGNNEWVQIA
ncbi:MAG: hypothetical protein J6P09_00540 [Methanobrevibacter sp.]|nr:hypothetical protein [Methanobrevibacter sp.]